MQQPKQQMAKRKEYIKLKVEIRPQVETSFPSFGRTLSALKHLPSRIDAEAFLYLRLRIRICKQSRICFIIANLRHVCYLHLGWTWPYVDCMMTLQQREWPSGDIPQQRHTNICGKGVVCRCRFVHGDVKWKRDTTRFAGASMQEHVFSSHVIHIMWLLWWFVNGWCNQWKLMNSWFLN